MFKVAKRDAMLSLKLRHFATGNCSENSYQDVRMLCDNQHQHC